MTRNDWFFLIGLVAAMVVITLIGLGYHPKPAQALGHDFFAMLAQARDRHATVSIYADNPATSDHYGWKVAEGQISDLGDYVCIAGTTVDYDRCVPLDKIAFVDVGHVADAR